MRIPNDFTEGEVQVLDFIVQALQRGESAVLATRNRDFSSLARKVMAMKAKVNQQREEKHSRDLPPSEGEPEAR